MTHKIDGYEIDVNRVLAKVIAVSNLTANERCALYETFVRLQAEVTRLNAREKSAEVCDYCSGDGREQILHEWGMETGDAPCEECEGTGIVYDGS